MRESQRYESRVSTLTLWQWSLQASIFFIFYTALRMCKEMSWNLVDSYAIHFFYAQGRVRETLRNPQVGHRA